LKVTVTIQELAERITKALVQDAYETNDISLLINMALNQKDALDLLAADNERLTEAVAEAGKHITSLEKQVESLEPFSHLAQYAEENN
jgi:hypothetical protein